MKFTMKWFFGVNSLWAKFCKKIGRYPQWVHQETVSVLVCNISALLATIHCVDAQEGVMREYKELSVPTEDCPYEHLMWVYGEACTETSKKANQYCPSTYNKKMTQEEFDKWVNVLCKVHKKPIPPPPPPPPIRPYIGASYYQLQIENASDIKEFIEKLREHGANATEIFLNFTWPLSENPYRSHLTSGWQFSPHKIVSWWDEPKFGDYQFPKYDLSKWNWNTWGRLKIIFEECWKNGIALFIRINDYCSIKRGFSKRHCSFNNGSNVQQYTGGMWGDPIRKWYRKLNTKLIGVINEAKLKHFFIVPMNEADVLGDDWPGGEEEKDLVCKQFHQFYIDDLGALGVRKDQLVMSIDRPNVKRHFKVRGYRIEEHGINSPVRLKERFKDEGTEIFADGDGPDGNARGIASYNGNREPTKAQGVEMGRTLKDKFGYCYFLRSTESQPNSGNVKLADFVALDGLIKGLELNPPPPPPPPPDKKLLIRDKKIHYKGKPIKLIGCSRYMALFLDHDPENWPNWGVSGLAEYERALINSGINYVRHACGKDMGLLRKHCKRMGEHGIIVEVGLYCEHISDRMGDPFKAVDATIALENVFYDCHNEFLKVDDVDRVRSIIRYVKDKGGICSAGAWGHSDHGLEYSERFDPINSDNNIASVHREWTQDWITRYTAHKPVVRNEYFDLDNDIGFDGMKRIMCETMNAGASGCQYYMFNDDIWKERLKWAGEYCRELNQ